MDRPHLLQTLRVRSLFLLGALLAVILAVPLQSLGVDITGVTRLLYTVVICIGGYLLSPTRKWLSRFLIIAIPAFGIGVIDATPATTFALSVTHDILGLLLQILLFSAVVAFTLFDAKASQVDRIVAGICGYIILGFFWSSFYGMMESFIPGSLLDGGEAIDAKQGSIFYFSFVTLTTLGYGDVLPAHPVTRTAASLQSLAGSLYLAVFVAALVSGLGPKEKSDDSTVSGDS